jgi:acyl-coenzyme A thioesterase PaaI-like protein
MIIKLENTFSEVEGFNCFACGPEHPFGLKLSFSYDDEKDIVFTRFQPDELFAGFPTILHGGIQATILDELAFWGTWAKFKQSGFTYDLSVRYRKKCPVDRILKGKAVIGDVSHRLVSSETQLIDPETEEIFTEGVVRYYLPARNPKTTGSTP